MNKSARGITWMGLLLALALGLSFFEMTLVPVLALPVGVKLGLSNLVVMFALFHLDGKSAILLACLKSGFVFLIRGMTSFLMSISGGIISVLGMYLFLLCIRKRKDILATSVLGGILHNVGQIMMAAILIGSEYVTYYFPILLISGIVVGGLNGVLLMTLLPKMKEIKP